MPPNPCFLVLQLRDAVVFFFLKDLATIFLLFDGSHFEGQSRLKQSLGLLLMLLRPGNAFTSRPSGQVIRHSLLLRLSAPEQ